MTRRSSVVERVTHTDMVGGSIPPAATIAGVQQELIPVEQDLELAQILQEYDDLDLDDRVGRRRLFAKLQAHHRSCFPPSVPDTKRYRAYDKHEMNWDAYYGAA